MSLPPGYSLDVFLGHDITPDLLAEASVLFSENYGVWGPRSPNQGKRVRLSPARLRQECIPVADSSLLIRAVRDARSVGHVLAARWDSQGRRVCWVTQLVVHESHRRLGLATCLLRGVGEALGADVDVYGVMSSHPATCLAFSRSFAGSMGNISLAYVKAEAGGILADSPARYVRDAAPCGSLFRLQDKTGLVCGADSKFYLDHEEPREVLAEVRLERGEEWILGDLVEGAEYLLLWENGCLR